MQLEYLYHLSLVVLLSAIVECNSKGPSNASIVRPSRIAFIHRKGARYAMHFDSKTGTFYCPSTTTTNNDQGVSDMRDNGIKEKYCLLTENGVKMGRALGEILRDDYGVNSDTSITFGEALLPTEYNVTAIKSRATANRGVVETGEAVLIGMFNTTDNTVLPFVPYPPQELDDMMSFWSSIPSWSASAHEKVTLNNTAEEIMTIIGGKSNMDIIAMSIGVLPFSRCYSDAERSSMANLNSEGSAAHKVYGDSSTTLTPGICVLAAYDQIAANYSNGVDVPPALGQLWDNIKEAVGYLYMELYGYRLDDIDNRRNNNHSYIDEVGSLGALWAEEVLSFFSLRNDNNRTVVRHYAAHDKTLVAVQGALGMFPHNVSQSSPLGPESTQYIINHTHRLLPPEYGAVIILEYYSETDRVVARWGSPSQIPSNALPEMWLEYAPITCLDPITAIEGNIGGNNGALQTVSVKTRLYQPHPLSSGCPLSHLVGYVNITSQQKAPIPYGRTCYYTRSGLAAIGCLSLTDKLIDNTNNKTKIEMDNNAACLRFRKRCPFIPCGLEEGYITDPSSGYQCKKMANDSEYDKYAVVVTIVAVSVIGLVPGVVIGYFGVGTLLLSLIKKRSAQ